MRAASPSTGFYRTSPRPPGAGERPHSGGWETEDADFVDGQEPEPEPESPKEVSSPTKVASPKGAATSNLYDEEEIEQPPVPMLPCLLRTPKMHEDRDNHARFLRNEAANFRAELKYDDKRRQSEQLWSLITSKEKDRRLVMMRLRKLLGEGADVDELSETKMSLIPPPASADAADQEEEDDDDEEEEGDGAMDLLAAALGLTPPAASASPTGLRASQDGTGASPAPAAATAAGPSAGAEGQQQQQQQQQQHVGRAAAAAAGGPTLSPAAAADTQGSASADATVEDILATLSDPERDATTTTATATTTQGGGGGGGEFTR
jgi:hypothetical protein